MPRFIWCVFLLWTIIFITTLNFTLKLYHLRVVSIDQVSRRSKLFITVDGKSVTKVQKLDGCNVLVGEKGIHWGKKEKFKLRFRIHSPGTLQVMKISSIIIF